MTLTDARHHLIGETVHFVEDPLVLSGTPNGRHIAAVITDLGLGTRVQLHVLNSQCERYLFAEEDPTGLTPGTWHHRHTVHAL